MIIHKSNQTLIIFIDIFYIYILVVVITWIIIIHFTCRHLLSTEWIIILRSLIINNYFKAVLWSIHLDALFIFPRFTMRSLLLSRFLLLVLKHAVIIQLICKDHMLILWIEVLISFFLFFQRSWTIIFWVILIIIPLFITNGVFQVI
jgi:hypothetical protein